MEIICLEKLCNAAFLFPTVVLICLIFSNNTDFDVLVTIYKILLILLTHFDKRIFPQSYKARLKFVAIKPAKIDVKTKVENINIEYKHDLWD